MSAKPKDLESSKKRPRESNVSLRKRLRGRGWPKNLLCKRSRTVLRDFKLRRLLLKLSRFVFKSLLKPLLLLPKNKSAKKDLESKRKQQHARPSLKGSGLSK